MSVSINWDNPEKNIIYIRCEGQWAWDDYFRNADKAWAMTEEVDHPVGMIIHIVGKAAARPPTGAFSQWSSSMDDPHMSKIVQIILVSEQASVCLLVNISQRIFSSDKSHKFCAVQNLEQARNMLAMTR